MIALLSMLLIPVFLFASWNIGFDLRSIDAFWSNSMRFDIEGGYEFDDIRVSCLLSYGASSSNELSFLDCGISVAIYPFPKLGLNVGCSIIRVGKLFGIAAPNDDIVFSSEAFVAWIVPFSYFYVEPRFSFCDTLSSSTGALSILREGISQYSKFRLSLLMGVRI